MITGGIGWPVTKGHNEGDLRVMLGLIHHTIRLLVPAGPCFRRVGLRVCDEPRVPVIEPRPVLTAASQGWSALGCLRIRQFKASLVVSQIVVLLFVPLVIAPSRARLPLKELLASQSSLGGLLR